ncbi:MAG: metallophosphoesterase [Hyphomicrobiaceae bacterium]
MSFTFIHTADWQIGKAFGRFAPEVAALLRAARLDAIDTIASVAREAGARHVIVAGDVIDSELIEDVGLRQPLGRMGAYPDLTWHLLPGNHDPARGGGVWERMVRLGLPGNVMPLLSPAVCLIEDGIALLPAPLMAKQTVRDPSLWMEEARTPEGVIRIGVAHGSVQGFGTLGEASVPIGPSRRTRAGLDYLAIGDWHGTKEIGPGVWYSGTPEPDSFADNGPGHVLRVSIGGAGAEPDVQRIRTGRYQWREWRAVLSRLADFDPIEREVKGFGAEQRRLILSLVLEGVIGAAEAAALDERVARLAALPLATRVDQSRLRMLAEAADREQLGDPLLAAVAERLIAKSEGPDASEARAAARAMRLLLVLGAKEDRPEGGP